MYALVRPCTPSTPTNYTQYAHKKFVRPHNCTPMGVHGRTCTPTNKIPTIFCGRTMYAHVRPCTPMYAHGRTFVWAYKFSISVQCTPMYAHKNFTNKQNLVKDMKIPIKYHFLSIKKYQGCGLRIRAATSLRTSKSKWA